MTTLRWILGITTAVASAGFIAIAIIAGGFRRSFTGSDNSVPLVTIFFVSAGLVLASLVWPERRLLLHVVAVLMVALCIACAFIARQTAMTAVLGALYAIGWLTFYYRTVWAPAG
jgi:hypothetical protein